MDVRVDNRVLRHYCIDSIGFGARVRTTNRKDCHEIEGEDVDRNTDRRCGRFFGLGVSP